MANLQNTVINGTLTTNNFSTSNLDVSSLTVNEKTLSEYIAEEIKKLTTLTMNSLIVNESLDIKKELSFGDVIFTYGIDEENGKYLEITFKEEASI